MAQILSTLSGDGGGELFIAGGKGTDSIVISGFENDSTLAGGSGSDTILLDDQELGVIGSAFVFGGGGADSINISMQSGGTKEHRIYLHW